MRRNLPPDYDDVVQVEPTPYLLPPPPPSSAGEPSSPEYHPSPSSSSFAPLPSSPAPAPPPPPPGYTGPLQFVFLTEDVLNSKIIQAHSGNVAYTTSSANPAQTAIVDGSGVPVVDILWHWDDAPELNFDFKGQTVKLKQWMTKGKGTGVLFNIHHKDQSYDIFQAGPSALGVRLTQTTPASEPPPMLCGIRDPYRHVELVVSPEGMEAAVLPVAVTFVVLLRSKRPLGKELEGKKGVWRVFGGGGRSAVGEGGVAEVAKGKEGRKGSLRR